MYKLGLVVGRFQPFHKGHLYLFKKALEKAEKIIIAIGSSNVSDSNNPLSFEKRVEMLEKVIEHEGLGDKVLKIVPSPDHPDDDKWLDLLLENVGKFDFEMGNNDWTNNILKEKGYKVFEVPYLNRNQYQGFIIRRLFKEGGNWEEYVPAYLIDFIKKEFSKT